MSEASALVGASMRRPKHNTLKTMEELEQTARELILAITEKTLKSLKDKGLLKEPSKLQMLCSSPEMKSLIKKLSTPKYDPCRPFKKGDIVEPSAINGRLPEELQGCYRYKVIVGEGDMSNPLYVSVKPLLAANYKHVSEIHVNVVFLKLVTPVGKLEPYIVSNDDFEYCVFDQTRKMTVCRYDICHPHAKEAAEAERDRLNEEWRKEQNNG